jgi:chromate transport protein ChrA
VDIQQIAIYIGQWALIQLAKKFPKVGKWIDENAAAVVAIVATITTILKGLFAPQIAHAQTDTLAFSDSLAVVATVVPVYVASGFMGWLGNAAGTILADNVLRKILWHYVIGKLLKVKAAQSVPKPVVLIQK